jgi:HK97 family phage portal protein
MNIRDTYKKLITPVTTTETVVYQKRDVTDSQTVNPPTREAPADISVGTALSLAAVYRAVQINSVAVSQLELGVWRNGVEIETPSLVANPDVNSNLSQFLKRTVICLATTGNAYWRKYGQNPTVNLEVLNPGSMVIKISDTGKRTYEYSGYKKPVSFQENEIKHLKLLDVFGSEYGLGPIQAARAELSGAVKLRNYADTVFAEDSDLTNGVLSTNEYLDSETRNEYMSAWQQGYGVRVLGNGLTYAATLLSPADAQWLESQNFSVTQVARLFGVPAVYLLAEVSGNSITYQNHESIDIVFVKYTLMAYLREIEEALTDLTARGQTVRFKVEALLRADQATRYAAYKTAIESQWLSADEVRAMEGLPPKTSGFGPESIKEAIKTTA